jgi:phosphonate transport system substrate-binding protein
MRSSSLTRTVFTSLLLSTLLLAASASFAQLSGGKYSFAVVPQYAATDLDKEWAPVLQRISRETGLDLELKIAASIPKFEAEFLKGAPDFAYMNPYHAVMAHQAHGYVPLLRDKKPLSGILLIRKDSPYKSVRDLNGTTIAFPSPNAFGASLYMRALLSEEAGIKFEARYLNTHPNVYRHVLRNNAAAGGSVIAAFDDEAPEVREQMSILYRTPQAASHPVMVHPRVPEAVRRALTQAFLALAKDEAGRALLKEIRMTEPVPAVYERDYVPLEKLNLKKYLATEKN